MRKNLVYFKRGLSLLLLACAFLPLAHCSFGGAGQAPDQLQAVASAAGHVIVPIRLLSSDGFGYVLLGLLFFWPVLATLFGWCVRAGAGCRVLLIGEMILAVASLCYAALFLSFGGPVEYGGYLALAGFAAYLAATGWQIFRQMHSG